MNFPLTCRLPQIALPQSAERTAEPTSLFPVCEGGISDEALLAGIQGGNKEALAALFGRYVRLVRAIAMRILRDESEADDLLQDLFLFIYQKCPIFDPLRGSARSWIVQMAYQRAIDRRRYLSSRHFYTSLEITRQMDHSDPRYDTDEPAMPYELVGNTTMPDLLESLTEDQRKTLSLHFVEGCTFAEIAVRLDQSLGNIRNHYYRALEKLRKQMFPEKLPGRNGYGRK